MKRSVTGHHETSVAGGETVRAFVPASLPPAPPLDITSARARLHDQALLACGRLDAITTLLPEPDLFLYAYVRREAVLSSQIEGTQSSLSDLLLFELEDAPGVPFDDVVEVSSYVAALEHGLQRLRDGFPLCNRLLDATRHEGDWEAWLDFFLEGVRATATGAVDTAHRLLDRFRQDAERIQGLGRAVANALRVFDALRARPLATINDLTARTGVTYPTAGRAIEALERLGIVREITGRSRDRVFAYDAYLAILNEGAEPL
jgi:Fic family protein